MNNLPIELIKKSIIPFCSESDNLINLKLASKKFNEQILSHTFNLKCASCGSHKFSVHSDPNRCYIEGCLSTDIIHPFVKYYNKSNQPLCSFSCLVRESRK